MPKKPLGTLLNHVFFRRHVLCSSPCAAVDTVDNITALFERKEGGLMSFGLGGGLLGMRSFRVPVRTSFVTPILHVRYFID